MRGRASSRAVMIKATIGCMDSKLHLLTWPLYRQGQKNHAIVLFAPIKGIVNTIALKAVESVQTIQEGQMAAMQSATIPTPPMFGFPDHWPVQGELLIWCQQIGPGLAALMVLMGVVYLLFGYNIFKYLVVLNFACLGGVIGAVLGDKYGGSLPLAITCAFVLAVVTWPMMKFAVVATGSLCGAAIGVSLWRSFNLDPTFAWSGSGMGLIFFTMLTFILFRSSVMTFMSLQGAAMMMFGLLALVFKYDGLTPQVRHWFHIKPFLMPMLVFIPTVLGVIFQQKNATEAPAAASGKK